VSADKEETKVTLSGLPDRPGIAARLFGQLAGAGVNVDMIVQNIGDHGLADISFTVPAEDVNKLRQVIKGAAESIGVKDIKVDDDIAKVSIVGVGMRGHSGVAYRMFKTLAAEGINILMISTSEIKVSVLIRKALADRAMIALHKAFGLDKPRRAAKKR
jgi:aspartate kinase